MVQPDAPSRFRSTQREITTPGPLLDGEGGLAASGWARRPLLDANLENAARGRLGRLRLKRWDYYGIWTPGLFASATVAHIGYAATVFTYVVDRETGRHREHSLVRPFGAGVELPRSSERGDVVFDAGSTRIAFRVEPERRVLCVADERFDGGRGLEIEVALACPSDRESVVTATPFPGGGFYYNRKLDTMPATGEIRWGDRRFRARPDDSLGQLDWGRGIWPYRSHWVWATANGFLPDGRTLGLNLGFFGDHRHATEDAEILDGRVHKLERVRCDFDPGDYRSPWRFTEPGGRLDVRFEPASERVARLELLVLRTEVHQLFGTWSGRAVTDAGETLVLEALPGFAEEHHARW
jgi:hypothetical protein